jgi:uncharacterized membrane protein YfcA
VKLFAAPMFVVRKQVNYKVLLLLLAGGVPGALLGSYFLTHLKQQGSNSLMMVLLGVIIVSSAAVTFLRKGGTDRVCTERLGRLPWISLPIGIEVGFSSAGAGALGSLALMHWTTLASAEIVGTDILFGLALSTSAGAMHLNAGGVDTQVLQWLLIGGVPGSLAGAWLATVFPTRALRKGLALWLMCLGVNLCYRGLTA